VGEVLFDPTRFEEVNGTVERLQAFLFQYRERYKDLEARVLALESVATTPGGAPLTAPTTEVKTQTPKASVERK
jgi:hypothetical protein